MQAMKTEYDSPQRPCMADSYLLDQSVSHWRHALYVAVLLLAFTGSGWIGDAPKVQAEVIYHRRDHRDQGVYASDRRHTYHVQSQHEAMDYLVKYGYLSNCTLTSQSRRRRNAFHRVEIGDAIVHEESASQAQYNCSDVEIQQALRRLQRKFELRPSGRLDDATRTLMSRGRCGNSDSDMFRANNARQSFGKGSTRSLPEEESRGNSLFSHESVQNNTTLQDGRHTFRSRRRRRSGSTVRNPSSQSDVVSTDNPIRISQINLTTAADNITEVENTTEVENVSNSAERVMEIISTPTPFQPPSDTFTMNGSNSATTRETTVGLSLPTEQPQESLAKTLPIRVARDRDTAAVARGTASRRRQQMLSKNIEKNRESENMTRYEETLSTNQRDIVGERARIGAPSVRRKRRSISIQSMGTVSEGVEEDRTRFDKDENSPVQWRLLLDGISGKIPVPDQRAILELAFRMWSEVIPLKFHETNHIALMDMDVIIAFAKQNHMNCNRPFDGHGGELAHSWQAGDIHFDEDENYRRDDPSGTGIDLLKVAVHEIGHVLGLLHNDRANSIMYPIYVNPDLYEDFELSTEDRRAVQNIYGVCKGSFDLIFDWLRRIPSSDNNATSGWRYKFNTYFFRETRYWMYENRMGRARYGDPQRIDAGWRGLQGPLDGFTQVIRLSGQEFNIDTYFFQGSFYYKYDDEQDRLVAGYPRLISDDFGPRSGSNETVPDNIDAVFFDARDSLMYFFKGDYIWTYNPDEIGRNGCCIGGKRLFTTVFFAELSSTTTTTTTTPAREEEEQEEDGGILTGNIDAVFYSYHHTGMYFLKGEAVYRNEAYNDQVPGVNRVRRLENWYHIWPDICDVE